MPYRAFLSRNLRWAASKVGEDPDFFMKHFEAHKPGVMFIGCSDARVPADAVTDSDVGDLFVYRNIANQVGLGDSGVAAALEYAIEVLGVRDVVVCGHHGCGGCGAALGGPAPASVEAWITQLRLVARVHAGELKDLEAASQVDRLVEINVDEQVRSLSRHPVVRRAWSDGKTVRLHGWVYLLRTGLLESRLLIAGEEEANVLLSDATPFAGQAK